MTANDPYNLVRFVEAQDPVYQDVVRELSAGRKRTHWIWFIFPQIDGLGHSTMARRYAIKNLGEARAYLNHPILGKRLLDCAQLVGAIEGRSISEIFGFPDDLKFRSSMTLFSQGGDEKKVFEALISKYFAGHHDERTIEILNQLKKSAS